MNNFFSPAYKLQTRFIANSIQLCVLATLLFMFHDISAQTVVTISGSSVATQAPFDIGTANYTANGEIYLGTEIAASGTITTLEWNNFSVPPSVTIPVKIYMKAVSTATTTWATETYATAISGATLVYSGNVTFNANNYANPVTLTTGFAYTYTANNLEIITESDYGSVSASPPSWYYNTSVANSDCEWTSSSSSLSGVSNSGGIDGNRPDIKITISAPAITVGSISPVSGCAGTSTTCSVPYTASGTFNSGNVFTATLSNSSGVFSLGTNTIGTTTSTTSGTISGTLTLPATAGSGYKVEVTSSNPVQTSGNTAAFTVYAYPTVSAIANGVTGVCVNATAGTAFTDATGGGTWGITSGTGTATISGGGVVGGVTAGSVTVTYAVSANGCTTTNTDPITVYSLPVITSITPAATTACVGTAIALTANGGAAGSGGGSLTYNWTGAGTGLVSSGLTGSSTSSATNSAIPTYGSAQSYNPTPPTVTYSVSVSDAKCSSAAVTSAAISVTAPNVQNVAPIGVSPSGATLNSTY